MDEETPLMDDSFANLILLKHRLAKRIKDKEYQGYNDPVAWEFHDEFKRFITATEAVGTARGLFIISKYLPMFQIKERQELAVALADKARTVEIAIPNGEEAVYAKMLAFKTIYDSLESQQQLVMVCDSMMPETRDDFERFWNIMARQNNKGNAKPPPSPQP